MNQIVGSSVPLTVKDKTYLVAHVSLREWETFNGMLLPEGKKERALIYLIYCSLHRADNSITRKYIRKIIRRNLDAIIPLIDKICTISLPSKTIQEKTKVKKIDEKTKERNLKTSFRILSRMHGWTPNEISDLSPAQFYSYMMGGSTGTGIEKMTGPQYRKLLADRGMLKNDSKENS